MLAKYFMNTFEMIESITKLKSKRFN